MSPGNNGALKVPTNIYGEIPMSGEGGPPTIDGDARIPNSPTTAVWLNEVTVSSADLGTTSNTFSGVGGGLERTGGGDIIGEYGIASKARTANVIMATTVLDYWKNSKL